MGTQTESWDKEVLYQLQHDEAYAHQFIEKMIKAGEDPTAVLERVLGVKVAREFQQQGGRRKS